MALAYLSLGSNVGDREALLHNAIFRLGPFGRVTDISPLYETEPVEVTAQPFFLNCAVALETELTPSQLMRSLLHIELEMGRRRSCEKGPRPIDLDILLFNQDVIATGELTIPHPAMAQRRFVLEPLAEIAPLLRHPVLRKTILQMRDALPPGQKVKKIDNKESLRHD